MSEEEKNDNENEQAEAAAEETAEPEAAPEPEPADEAAPEPDAADQAAPEAEAADEPEAADEAAPEAEAEPAAAAEDAEPEEVLSRKEQRKRRRSLHTGEAKPERGIDERATERAERRAKAAAGRRRTRAQARSKHQPGEGTAPAERAPGAKKTRQGTVVSSKADKTITVRIEVVRRHPVYEKVVRKTATIHAHDESNDANAGDVVRVIESRPMSRTKRWRLVEVVERAR